jgi:hypothetical protein
MNTLTFKKPQQHAAASPSMLHNKKPKVDLSNKFFAADAVSQTQIGECYQEKFIHLKCPLQQIYNCLLSGCQHELGVPRLSIKALDQVDHVNAVERLAVKQRLHGKGAL